MYFIEYRHKRTLGEDRWKSMKLHAKDQVTASIAVSNLSKLYGQDFEFRSESSQLLSNIKPIR